MKKFVGKGVILVLSLLVLSGCNFNTPEPVELEPVTLQYWGFEDRAEALEPLISSYQAIHPQVEIVYTQIDERDYLETLLEGMADGNGPDIYTLPAEYLPSYKGKIRPLIDRKTVLPGIDTRNGNQPANIEKNNVTTKKVNNDFLPMVYPRVVQNVEGLLNENGDAVVGLEGIYGLPLSADTLVMYYNTDVLSQAGYERAPTTWSEFREIVMKIARYDEANRIYQAGAALGTGNNVRYAFDIISLIMMQNQTVMTDGNGQPSFARQSTNSFSDNPPGIAAVDFYTSFGLSFKDAYTWNKKMPDSFEAFLQGRTAMYFGYMSDMQKIKDRSPKLSFDYAPVPQITDGGRVNYGRFNVETVYVLSQNPEYAWDFIQHLANINNVDDYTTAMGQLTPLKVYIGDQTANPELGRAAGQLLTSKEWFYGRKVEQARQVFRIMVDDVIEGKYEFTQNAVKKAEDDMQLLY